MTFQITDIPRLLPELMLLALALLVLGTDVLERWGTDAQSQLERGKAAGQLTVIGLGFVFIVALVQSKFLFTVPEPAPGTNPVLFYLITLGRNLQAGGPGGEPILGAFATDTLTMIARHDLYRRGVSDHAAGAGLSAIRQPRRVLRADPVLDRRHELYGGIVGADHGVCVAGAVVDLAVYSGRLLPQRQALVRGRHQVLSVRRAVVGHSAVWHEPGVWLHRQHESRGGGQPIIGTLFSEIAKAGTAAQGGAALLTLAMIFVVAGIGYKVAVVPFHSWSPDVYQGAPTPITAFISTASKTAGFILLYRVLAAAFPSIAGTPSLTGFGGWTSLLALIALATVLVGNLSALPQKNAKRLLAYSSIGHAGFLLLALMLWGSASPADKAFSTSSLVYYLIAYTATNLGAFGALAVVREALGGDDMADLNGLWRRNIGLTLMLTVLVLSLAGVPPLSGYWAKFFVFMAGYKAGAVWLVGIGVVMTIVSLYYYLGFLKAMWMNEPKSLDPVPTPPAMNATLIVATVLVLLLGLFPNAIWNILGQAALVAGR